MTQLKFLFTKQDSSTKTYSPNYMRKYKAPENAIKNEILAWLRSERCFAWPNDSVGIWDKTKQIYRRKNSIFFIRGVADILGIWKGKPLAIETKSKIGKLSIEQEIFLKTFMDHGGIAIVARNLADVVRVLSPEKLALYDE